nr:hypothetical protein BaRGS_035335 [Batillaria attramentaria]
MSVMQNECVTQCGVAYFEELVLSATGSVGQEAIIMHEGSRDSRAAEARVPGKVRLGLKKIENGRQGFFLSCRSEMLSADQRVLF